VRNYFSFLLLLDAISKAHAFPTLVWNFSNGQTSASVAALKASYRALPGGATRVGGGFCVRLIGLFLRFG
jgi:hypothetical protein